MKTSTLLPLLVFSAAIPAFAQDQDERDIFEMQRNAAVATYGGNNSVDAKKIINQSTSFLKEREPEMTSEEFALYEKVVTMLTTNVDFAVKMLEAMMNEKEPPSPAFEFILGNAYYAANQVEQAEKSDRSAVKRYPSFLRAWNNLGVLYYTSNRFSDAVTTW